MRKCVRTKALDELHGYMVTWLHDYIRYMVRWVKWRGGVKLRRSRREEALILFFQSEPPHVGSYKGGFRESATVICLHGFPRLNLLRHAL